MIPAPKKNKKRGAAEPPPPTPPQEHPQPPPTAKPQRGGGVEAASWFYEALAREYDVGRIAEVLDRLTSYRFTQEIEFFKAASDLRAIIAAATQQWVTTLAIADPCTRMSCIAAKTVAALYNIMFMAHHLIYTTRYEKSFQYQSFDDRLRYKLEALRTLRLIKTARGLVLSAARGVAALSYVEPYGSWAFLAHLFRRRARGEGGT